ncbi:hypothetical protein HDV05_006856 [Chytridiales sp. JEL 0842]|nr:hypothetical protein HDV05_006856 [Chytridiales sp. JEL 0842]
MSVPRDRTESGAAGGDDDEQHNLIPPLPAQGQQSTEEWQGALPPLTATTPTFQFENLESWIHSSTTAAFNPFLAALQQSTSSMYRVDTATTSGFSSPTPSSGAIMDPQHFLSSSFWKFDMASFCKENDYTLEQNDRGILYFEKMTQPELMNFRFERVQLEEQVGDIPTPVRVVVIFTLVERPKRSRQKSGDSDGESEWVPHETPVASTSISFDPDNPNVLCIKDFQPPKDFFGTKRRWRLSFRIDSELVEPNFTFTIQAKRNTRKRKNTKSTTPPSERDDAHKHSDEHDVSTRGRKVPRLLDQPVSAAASTPFVAADASQGVALPVQQTATQSTLSSLLQAISNFRNHHHPHANASLLDLIKTQIHLLTNNTTTTSDSVYVNPIHRLTLLHHLTNDALPHTDPLLPFLLQSTLIIQTLPHQNHWGHTCFSNAVYFRRNDAARMLLKKMEARETRKEVVRMQSRTGANVLHSAAGSANFEFLKEFFDRPEEFGVGRGELREMLGEEATINSGATALDVAYYKLTHKAKNGRQRERYRECCRVLVAKMVELELGVELEMVEGVEVFL